MDFIFEQHLTAILAKTFDVIDNVYGCNCESFGQNFTKDAGSRMIFPSYSKKYRNGETRICKQELRSVFIEQFNKYCDTSDFNAFYSIETPTIEKYDFSDKSNPHMVTPGNKEGQSEMVDLTIHGASGERLCIMEFKFQNPLPSAYKKDIAKLNAEISFGILVQILKNADDRTIKNIRTKIQGLEETRYVCHCLKTRKTYYLNLSTSPEGWETI